MHPMAKLAMKILDNPSAKELMMYLAVAGLASNFAAVKALVSVGIQKGHMKMHLSNMMNQLLCKFRKEHRGKVQEYFQDKTGFRFQWLRSIGRVAGFKCCRCCRDIIVMVLSDV